MKGATSLGVLPFLFLVLTAGAHAEDEPSASTWPSARDEGKLHLLLSVGPVAGYRGWNLGAGLSYSPWPWVSLIGDLEYIGIPYQRDVYRDANYEVISEVRGGTEVHGLIELKVSPFAHFDVSPYFITGRGFGTTRLNDLPGFSTGPLTDSGRALVLGAGIEGPRRARVRFFIEGRLAVLEVGDGSVSLPLKFGVKYGL